ncbi:arsenic transporter [Edaphobacter acidisoli]|uniref:Arsenic transporter n=2 Tax=Edaphobacter acidisoli TaxID=2040573 RepID=A0A916VZC4_9BACT|nr:arsenic transporter [Edaphobacter acidisoli]
MPASHLAIWAVFAASIALMLLRPRNIPEVWWVSGGAMLMVALRLITPWEAAHAIAKGTDVYLFLAGMMLLAQLAQSQGVFDWLAAFAVEHSRGSRMRMFALVYAFGTLVTIFLSNDATAVVLTPAVLAATRKTKADPLPYLLICAFVANAASFVLPISNPANLVVFHSNVPPLASWFSMFLAASVASIVVTFFALRWYCNKPLQGEMQHETNHVQISRAGWLTLGGLAVVAGVLLTASAQGKDLGLPTCMTAVVIAIAISAMERRNPLALLGNISWGIIPLVAGLFVLVEALGAAGALGQCQAALLALQHWKPLTGAVTTSFAIGIGANLINNLPLGLIAGAGVVHAHITGALRNAVLIGIDLGPNLSVTGSLATILWLMEIRKEDIHVSGWTFLKAGLIVMPSALVVATLAAIYLGW